MTLVAPAWLGLLGLAPLIVLLHMRRHRPQDVPSTRIWNLVAQGGQPPPVIRRPPLTRALLLQLLALAVFALTLAQPELATDDAPPRVLVIDAGAAMALTDVGKDATRFQAGIESWLADVEREGRVGPLSVWLAGPETRPIALELDSLAAVRRAVDGSRPVDTATDWGAVAARMAHSLDTRSRLTFVTADTEAASNAIAALDAATTSEVKVVDVAGQSFDLALNPLSVTLEQDETSTWRIQTTVEALNAESPPQDPVRIQVRFRLEGTASFLPYADEELAFSLGGTAKLDVALELPGPGLLQVEIVGQDSYAADDVQWLHLNPQPERLSAVVLSPFGSDSPSVRVIESLERFDVSVAEAWSNELAAGDHDLVVVEGMADPFTSGPRVPDSTVWVGTAPGVTSTADLEPMDPGITSWDKSHPATSGTSWGRLSADRALSLPTTEAAEVLVAGAAGPLVEARTSLARRELVVALDPTDLAWTAGTEFFTFLVDVVEWLAPQPRLVDSCVVGVACRLNWDWMSQVANVSHGDRTVWITPEPSATRVSSLLDQTWVPDQAGLWSITGESNLAEQVAVNISPTALEAVRSAGSGDASIGVASGGFRLRTVIAWIALCAAVILLEGLLAGRGDERYWRKEAWTGSTPPARRSRRVALLQVASIAVLVAALFSPPFLKGVDDRVLVVVDDHDATGTDELSADFKAWPEASTRFVDLSNPVDRAIDIEQGVENALASVDPLQSMRIVVVPPGEATRGNALLTLPALISRGVPLDYSSSRLPVDNDASVERLELDRDPFVGDVVELHGVIYSDRETEATLRVWRNDIIEDDRRVEIQGGRTIIRSSVLMDEEGPVRFAVEIHVDDDPEPANDRLETIVQVSPAPRVAIYGADVERSQAFAEALELQGYEVDSRLPHTLGTRPADFLQLESVVLMDVPAIELSSSQQNALESWVSSSGGGLTILGGERSFGPGGYLETPLDSLSPLSSKVPREAPEVAMLFVLDRSGSMQQTVDGVTRLDVAKEATLTAIELLGEGSQVAIVVFDEQAHTLLPFTASNDTDTITAALSPLVPGGGTALYPGLERAAELLASTEAASRHVVVMTDGLSQPGDIGSAVSNLAQLDTTVSAIAIGTGSDVERVREIARLGGGTAHTTTDFRALPSILAQEAMLLSGDPVVRESVVPQRTTADPGLMGDMPSAFPPLAGFVETTAKSEAHVLLQDDQDRPLLAAWRYGAGRVISYAAHGVGPWSEAWSEVSTFPAWWGQWIRWTVQASPRRGLNATATLVGDAVRVDAQVLGEDGEYLSGLDLRASTYALEDTQDAVHTYETERSLVETNPGMYSAWLAVPPQDLALSIRAAGKDEAIAVEPLELTFTHTYPARLKPYEATGELASLSQLTGGRRLTGEEEVWPDGRQLTWHWLPAWRPWLLLGLAIWLLHLTTRYAPGWLRLGSTRNRGVVGTRANPTPRAVRSIR